MAIKEVVAAVVGLLQDGRDVEVKAMFENLKADAGLDARGHLIGDDAAVNETEALISAGETPSDAMSFLFGVFSRACKWAIAATELSTDRLLRVVRAANLPPPLLSRMPVCDVLHELPISSSLARGLFDENVDLMNVAQVRIAMLNVLLRAGIPVDACNTSGEAALLSAATMDRTGLIVKSLLDAQANPNLRSASGDAPLVVSLSNPVVVPILLAAGADPNTLDTSGDPVLVKAARSYTVDLGTVLELLDAGADMTLPGCDGKPAPQCVVDPIVRVNIVVAFEMWMPSMTPIPPAATLYAAVVEAVAVSETEIEIEEVSGDGGSDESPMDDRTAAMFDDPPLGDDETGDINEPKTDGDETKADSEAVEEEVVAPPPARDIVRAIRILARLPDELVTRIVLMVNPSSRDDQLEARTVMFNPRAMLVAAAPHTVGMTAVAVCSRWKPEDRGLIPRMVAHRIARCAYTDDSMSTILASRDPWARRDLAAAIARLLAECKHVGFTSVEDFALCARAVMDERNATGGWASERRMQRMRRR